jgi:hypothetical protein
VVIELLLVVRYSFGDDIRSDPLRLGPLLCEDRENDEVRLDSVSQFDELDTDVRIAGGNDARPTTPCPTSRRPLCAKIKPSGNPTILDSTASSCRKSSSRAFAACKR